MWDKLHALAPILVGVFWGVLLQLEPGWSLVALTGAGGAAGYLAMGLGAGLLRRAPLTAVTVMQAGLLLPVTIIALTTCVTTWLALNFEDWLKAPEGAALGDASKTVSGVLLGAINAFVAGLWLDDAEKPESAYWPAGAAKAAFGTAFKSVAEAGRDNAPLVEAVFEDRVSEGGPTGWGYSALRRRIGVIRPFLTRGPA